jgi:soluble lytic murein transglycosylase-like protein
MWFRLAAARGHALSARLARNFGGLASTTSSGCPGLDLGAALAHETGSSAGTGGTRAPIVAPEGHFAETAPPRIVALVSALAPEYDLDPALVLAVIGVESGFQAAAVSARHAQGLMQLMPQTAARFGVVRTFDPEENIRGGMKYLRWLHEYFDGDQVLVLAAYNAGEGAVDRYGGVPPFAETVAYIEKIRRVYRLSPGPLKRIVAH